MKKIAAGIILFFLCMEFGLVQAKNVSADVIRPQAEAATQEHSTEKFRYVVEKSEDGLYSILVENGSDFVKDLTEVEKEFYILDSLDFGPLDTTYEIEKYSLTFIQEETKQEGTYSIPGRVSFFNAEEELEGEEKITFIFTQEAEVIDALQSQEQETLTEITDQENTVSDEIPSIMETSLLYKSSVKGIGWTDFTGNGDRTGTIGERRMMEAFAIMIESKERLGVSYQVARSFEGWLDAKKDGEIIGEAGSGKPIEAISVMLTGEDKDLYDLYYRVHVSKLGWLPWAKNGQRAGTEGYQYQVEAFEGKLLPKGTPFETGKGSSYLIADALPYVRLELLLEEYGWQLREDGLKENTGLKGVRFSLLNHRGLELEHSVYTEEAGWSAVSDSEERTSDEKLLALKIALNGEYEASYDIYYRVKLHGVGWMGWTSNGNVAGSNDLDQYMEDVEVLLLEKGDDSLQTGRPSLGFDTNYRVRYDTHVQKKGWMIPSYDGELGGTYEGHRMESMKIELSDDLPSGSIHYQSHVESFGWMDEVSDGEISGTVGLGKRMEALRIYLSGEVANQYDVYYRVKVPEMEWLGWAKNGEDAGTEGFRKPIEAMEVVLIHKDESSPDQSVKPYHKMNSHPVVLYKSISSGFQEPSYLFQGEISGTVGRKLGLTGFTMKVIGDDTLFVRYNVFKRNTGWVSGEAQEYGLLNDSGIIEAVKLELHGDDKSQYDLYYRVHVQKLGWLEWTRNGHTAGTLDRGLQVEAIQVQLLPKNQEGIIGDGDSFVTDKEEHPFSYVAHVQSIGWQNAATEGQWIGTVGRRLRMEAFSLTLGNKMPDGTFELKAYVGGLGWRHGLDSKAGTVGESRRLEEISINLSGYVSSVYDVYYRSHVSKLGWLGWAKNGEKSGSALYDYQIEAIEVQLVEKGEQPPQQNLPAFRIKLPDQTYTKYMTRNDCYVQGEKIIPQGIMIHSTAVPGVMAGEWFNRWNKSYKAGETTRQVAVHAFIDDKETWQYLPWDHRGWHAGGAANGTHIGIEMTEPAGHYYYGGGTMIGYDAVKNQAYFDSIYNRTVTLSVFLSRLYNLDPMNIISHNEGAKLGVASNHSDVEHWFPRHSRTMDQFRAAVKKGLGQ